MTTDSPVVILFNSDGYEVNVKPGVAIPTGTTAIIAAGSDGTNSRFMAVDISGRPIIVGAGTAGTPVGGVVSIQGVVGGQAIPISGTVTATNASTGATGAAPPSQATYIGGLSTTASPSYTTGQLNALSLTLAGALRIDGSAVTQPISGTVAATQSGTWNINNISGTITLPTGAATETTLATLLTTSAFQARINTLGQKTMANSTPVVLASDQSAIPVSQSGAWTVTANAGTGSFTVIGTGTDNTTNSTAKLPVLVARANTAAPTWTDTNMVPLSVDTTGALRITGTISAPNASVSATGAAPPASATYIGGSVTTAAPTYTTGQMNALSLTTGGLLRIDGSGVTQPVSGTVTANIGTSGSLALEATQVKLTITQGTALGTNTQVMVGGSVTTAAPTYTTGNINPLSLTTAGALRIDGSGSTQPVSGTVTSNQGTNNTLANRWPVIITDGTNTMPTADTVGRSSFHRITDGTNTAAVKAASTAAVAGDPALVVAISPNNTIVTSNASVGLTAATPPGSATYMGGSVTTAAPTYTTGQMNALSLTTGGLLRIDGSGVTQPVSGTVTVQQATAANLNATVVQSTPANLRSQTSSESNTGAAVPTQASMVGGTDGTNLRAFSTDASGRQIVIGAAANAAAVTGNPVLIAGSDGTNARTLKTLTDGAVVTRYKELATFTGVATDIAVANNKSMLSIVNASGSTVVSRISAIYVTSVQTTGVTGVVGNFELRRITNHSAGTAITAIEKMDSGDSLNASITVRTNGTVTSESTNLLWRSVFSTDEWSVNNAIDTAAEGHLLSTMFPIWKRADFDNKPIILNANEGLTIKFATNSSVGTFDIMIVFTQE